MTEFEKVNIHRGDDAIRRDRYGRYLLPDPETGKERSWTRVTTIANTLKERRALEQWDQRNIVYGMGQRPSLYARAAASTLSDRKGLQEIANRAREAADSQAGADVGTAIHTFTERIDRGEAIEIPEPYSHDVDAYCQAMELAGMVTCLGWIERVVIIPELKAAGTVDRLVNGMWPLPRIGDIKTATDKIYDTGGPVNTVLAYGMVDIPLQLALYAHASHWWDGEHQQWIEMPVVDQERAMIMHVPVGLGECRIYEVDIAAGWEAVQLAVGVRDWRKRKDLAELVLDIRSPNGQGEKASNQLSSRAAGKETAGEESSGAKRSEPAGEGSDISRPEEPPAPDPPVSSVTEKAVMELFRKRHVWTQARVNAIKEHDEARSRLAGLWSLRDDIPTFPNSGPRNPEELDVILGFCALVEMEFSLPFPEENDPAIEPKKPNNKKPNKGKG